MRIITNGQIQKTEWHNGCVYVSSDWSIYKDTDFNS
jgi:hypothetical protein